MVGKLEDPLADLSRLSLIPQSLISLDSAICSDVPETEPIQSIFTSLTRKGSGIQLLEQSEAIMSSYTKLESVYSGVGFEPFAPNDKNPTQERRPALGRKRARFSMMPESSTSIPIPDIHSSVDHIEDPEEYFLLVEQNEQAEKELLKLTGQNSIALSRHPTTTRKRRPGLRETTSCRFQFSAKDVSSQILTNGKNSHQAEASFDTMPSNTFHSGTARQPDTFQANTTNSKLQDAAAGTEADTEKRKDNGLGELLSSFKDLDENEEETVLRESLQLKPINIRKLSLGNIGNSKTIDSNWLNSRLLSEQLKGSKIPQTSPSVAKSPSAAVVSLSSYNDMFAAPYSDDDPPSRDSAVKISFGRVSLSPLRADARDKRNPLISGAFSPVIRSGVQTRAVETPHSPVAEEDEVIGGKIACDEEIHVDPLVSREKNTNHCSNDIEVGTNIEADGVTGGKSTLDNNIPVDSPNPPDENTVPLSSDIDADQNITSSEFDGFLQERYSMELDPLTSNQPSSGSIDHIRTEDSAALLQSGIGQKFSSNATDHDYRSHAEANTALQDKGGNAQVDDGASSSRRVPLVANQDQGVVAPLEEQSDKGHHRRMKRKTVAHRGKKNTSVAESQSLADDTRAPLVADQDQGVMSLNKESDEMSPGSPSTRRNMKAVARKREGSKRKSLAGAGSVWKSGVRRSTRIRSRPLEHWRGERFVYARIHDTLSTVVGIKYASPGNAALKVKSFVSDEYADIVQAAAH